MPRRLKRFAEDTACVSPKRGFRFPRRVSSRSSDPFRFRFARHSSASSTAACARPSRRSSTEGRFLSRGISSRILRRMTKTTTRARLVKRRRREVRGRRTRRRRACCRLRARCLLPARASRGARAPPPGARASARRRHPWRPSLSRNARARPRTWRRRRRRRRAASAPRRRRKPPRTPPRRRAPQPPRARESRRGAGHRRPLSPLPRLTRGAPRRRRARGEGQGRLAIRPSRRKRARPSPPPPASPRAATRASRASPPRPSRDARRLARARRLRRRVARLPPKQHERVPSSHPRRVPPLQNVRVPSLRRVARRPSRRLRGEARLRFPQSPLWTPRASPSRREALFSPTRAVVNARQASP